MSVQRYNSDKYLKLLYELDECKSDEELDRIRDELYDLVEDGIDKGYVRKCYLLGIGS